MSEERADKEHRAPSPGADPRLAVDLTAGILLFALAVFALTWLVPNHTEPSFSDHDVAPGFFPSMSAWAVLGLSAVLIASGLRRIMIGGARVGRDVSVLVDLGSWVILASLAVVGFGALGFLWTAPPLIAVGMVLAGSRKIWLILAVAILFPLLIDFAAFQLFTVDLP
ncbi:MAG: tripartite tricarboxylate transporter TctB family protein [Pseudomonadota bacterium]